MAVDARADRLLRAAERAMGRAYSPYSKTRIGAAILTRSGRVHLGASIGNASSALNSCAEQAAVIAAVMKRDLDLVAIAVVQASGEPVVPCGRCLQLLSEFAKDMSVITRGPRGRKEWRLRRLLPVPFRRPSTG